jgi:hypothetical protein
MTSIKISISTFVFLLYATIGFSQKSNIFYTQFTGKNGSFSMNYDRKIGSTEKENVYFSLYGHVGVGKFSSQEIITTKFVKGTKDPNFQFSNDPAGLLLGIFFNLANTQTPDITLERRQSFDVTNHYLGGKILLGKGAINVIVGLDLRFDRVKQTTEPWENIPEQTKYFTKAALSPSVGLRWNKELFTAHLLLAPQKVYGVQGSTDGVINVGLGFQF